MPNVALPRPHVDTARAGWGLLLHRYTDPLGRPLTGVVTIIATQRLQSGSDVVPSTAKADVELSGGVLQVQVLPGTYRLLAHLHSTDGHEVIDDTTVTVTA